MERKHLPKLNNKQIGENILGWFLVNTNEGKKVIFQCPSGHRAGLELHSIDRNGEVNASVLCYENDYHEMVILDDWDNNFYKVAGEETIKKIEVTEKEKENETIKELAKQFGVEPKVIRERLENRGLIERQN